MSVANDVSYRLQERYYRVEDAAASIDAEKSRLIARLFARVFADPPWNEYKICPSHHYTGKENPEKETCFDCGGPLTLAYPENEMMEYITRETTKPGSLLVVFEDENKIPQAAGWGFSCQAEEFAGKYSTLAMREKGKSVVEPFLRNGSIFYLSEILVENQLRGNGIGKRIATALADRAKQLNLNMVLHTHGDSPMAKIAERIGMVPLLKRGEDSENAGRILYLLR